MAKTPKPAALAAPVVKPTPRLIDRFTVVDDGGHIEILADGETMVAESGAKAELIRELGRVIEQEKAGQSTRLAALVATGNELLRSTAIPGDWAEPFRKALAAAEGQS